MPRRHPNTPRRTERAGQSKGGSASNVIDTEEVTSSILVSPNSITIGQSPVPQLRGRASCCPDRLAAKLPPMPSALFVKSRSVPAASGSMTGRGRTIPTPTAGGDLVRKAENRHRHGETKCSHADRSHHGIKPDGRITCRKSRSTK
jgi:hypothetical protein